MHIHQGYFCVKAVFLCKKRRRKQLFWFAKTGIRNILKMVAEQEKRFDISIVFTKNRRQRFLNLKRRLEKICGLYVCKIAKMF